MKQIYIEDFQGIHSDSGDWYNVINFLGGGGNGWTYLVMCTTGERRGNVFALKILYNILKKERVDKFLKEVAWMQKNHYPSILQQYDSGTLYNHPFVVMEHMPTTLAKEVSEGRVGLGQALLYAQQLISAVSYLHAQNYIHRDIKPENIFIKGSSAILGDFGLIKKITDEEDDVSEVKGYVAMPKYYRTPELIEYAKTGVQVGCESDVFQLGLVLAFMFTRKNPLNPVNNILDPISLSPVPLPKGKFGRRIHYVLSQMLKIKKEERLTLDKAQTYFFSIFEDYVKEKKDLDNEFDF